ncbi:MAG: DUF2314 domain-containing protein [Pirellulales bacterium]|nr:DUF2314 domain-containing protein [Pirellulales bacterium]
MRIIVRLFLVPLLPVMLGCSDSVKHKPASKTGNSETKLIPAGDLMADQMAYEFAIYYLPRPDKDPLGELNRLLKDRFKGFTKVEKISPSETQKAVAARIIKDVKESYAPPDLESLQHSGRGLDRQQATALQGCECTLVLDFAYPREHVWDGMREAVQLLSQLARATGGLVWDEETRETFTPDEWDKRRIAEGTEDVPDISNHITIHVYSSGEHVRAITLGMAKFGLPDVVVDRFSWSDSKKMGHLMNLLAQAMAEGAEAKANGDLDLDIKAIRHLKVRELMLSSPGPNATSKALLSLRKGVWEEGDPQNRLIAIGADRYAGPDVHARQEKMLGGLFGWEDSIVYLKHNEKILEASRRAKAKLPALKKAFHAGLAPGEFILLKAPFETPDGGDEWMWVEVTSWKGARVKGLLKNEPFNIPDLHSGQIVEISETEVFDYVRRYPDGRSEGNETGKIIQKNKEAQE